MQVYAAMVDRIDQNIGRLLNWLDSAGYAQNTVIFFMSDNGSSSENAGDGRGLVEDVSVLGTPAMWASLQRHWANVGNTPLRYYKNSSYEGGIRTPMIAWWPGRIQANTITDYNGHFVDILPTLLDMAGAPYPETFNGEPAPPLSGKSFLPALTREANARTGPLFFQWGGGQAMIEDDWKIVRTGVSVGDLPSDQPWSLFNLAEDGSETNDLSAGHPEKVAEMARKWNQWYSTALGLNGGTTLSTGG
jgi:arylsulfatase